MKEGSREHMSRGDDFDQTIDGDENVQINAEKDTTAAFGEEAMAAGRDITIINNHSVDQNTLDLYQKQIELLEEQLSSLKKERDENRQKKIAIQASTLSEEMHQNENIEFSSNKLIELGNAAQLAGRLGVAEGNYKHALLKFKNDGDRKGEGSSLNHLGIIADIRKDLAGTEERIYRESLATMRRIGDLKGEAYSLNNLGSTIYARGDLEESERLHRESLAIFREIGDRKGESGSLDHLGIIAKARGDLAEAELLNLDSLAISKELGDRKNEARSLEKLGKIALTLEKVAGAERLHQESLEIRRDIGDRKGELVSLNNLGNIAKIRGDFTKAERLFGESNNIKREIIIPVDQENVWLFIISFLLLMFGIFNFNYPTYFIGEEFCGRYCFGLLAIIIGMGILTEGLSFFLTRKINKSKTKN